jgi:hypothetical protein
MAGTAIEMAGTPGAVVSVLVCPTVIFEPATSAGGPACSWPRAMLNAPNAITALPPITAERHFTLRLLLVVICNQSILGFDVSPQRWGDLAKVQMKSVNGPELSIRLSPGTKYLGSRRSASKGNGVTTSGQSLLFGG